MVNNDGYDLPAQVFKKRRIEKMDELQSYLGEDPVSETMDALIWWKVILNANCFEILLLLFIS